MSTFPALQPLRLLRQTGERRGCFGFSDLKISSCADVINLMNVDAAGNECCVCSSASTEGSPVRRLPCEHCMCDMCLDKWMLARKKKIRMP